MNGLKIVLMSVLGFVVYGILHDQITARVCIEYFTIGHPPLIDSQDPTLIAFAWGFMATWWFGLLVGVVFAMCADGGQWQKMTWRDIVRPALLIFAPTPFVALVAGIMGFYASQAQWVDLLPTYYEFIPLGKQDAFIADLWAHTASYSMGALCSVILTSWTIWKRRKLHLAEALL